MTPLESTFFANWPDLLLRLGLTLLVALVAWVLVNVGIRAAIRLATKRAEHHLSVPGGRTRAVLSDAGLLNQRVAQRTATMGSILRSIANFVIIVVTVLTVMGTVGVPLAPLLASAGVGGLAIGFGAQSLVKDFLAGIFMIVEDQYGVGDLIDTGEVTGTVEEVGLRVTRLRDMGGQVWYVRNGEIKRVGNVSQGWSTSMVDIPVAYDADVPKALEVLRDVCAAVDADEQWQAVLTEAPAVLGVDQVTPVAVVLRVMLKTLPNQQWAVSRAVREQGRAALAQAGIKGPAVPAL